MAKKKKTPTSPPDINRKELFRGIKNLPKPKRQKWMKIGHRALQGDEGALSRLYKRGVLERPAGAEKKKDGADTPKTEEPKGQEITPYTPTRITDESLGGPTKVGTSASGGGQYLDAITKLVVEKMPDFTNAYAGASGTAGSTADTGVEKAKLKKATPLWKKVQHQWTLTQKAKNWGEPLKKGQKLDKGEIREHARKQRELIREMRRRAANPNEPETLFEREQRRKRERQRQKRRRDKQRGAK